MVKKRNQHKTPPKVRLVAVNSEGRRIGEDHPRAVLSDHDIELLWSLRALGWGCKRIAKKLECSRRHVRDVVKGRRRCQAPAQFKSVSGGA